MGKQVKIYRKRGKLRWGRILAAVLALVLVVALIVLGTRLFHKIGSGGQESSEDVSTASQESSETSKEEVQAPATVKFLSVGDNLIHSNLYQQANQRAGGNGYDFSFAYEKMADLVSSADIATINQETIIDSEQEPSSYPQFNSPVEVGDELEALGFDVVNLANNHMIDMYESGLRNAITYWNAKAPKIVTTGAYLNEEQLNTVEYNECNGIKFGYVGATDYTNGLSLPEGSELRYILTSETDLLKKKIEAAKAVCDVVIVNVHWGNEYSYEPTENQRNLAQQMVNWGADVIIGHHPHVLQPIEYLTKPNGEKALVVYSLGNFISAQDAAPRVVGGMVQYEITKNFETNTISIDNVVFEPLITHYGSRFSNIQVIPYSQYSDTLASQHGIRSETPDFSLEYIQNLVKDIIPAEFIKVF